MTIQGVIEEQTWRVNDERSSTRVIDDSFVNAVAALSGDHQRIHRDAEFAATTIFKRPIAHGVCLMLLTTEVLGMRIPGEGTIWQKMEMELKLPVYIGDTVTTTARITELEGRRMRILITCINQEGKLVGEGLQSLSYKRPAT
jgi:3-hydroxybutyryl-CoA dehydratase